MLIKNIIFTFTFYPKVFVQDHMIIQDFQQYKITLKTELQ